MMLDLQLTVRVRIRVKVRVILVPIVGMESGLRLELGLACLLLLGEL